MNKQEKQTEEYIVYGHIHYNKTTESKQGNGELKIQDSGYLWEGTQRDEKRKEHVGSLGKISNYQ